MQDMQLAEWAATSDGHRVLCSAARDALSRTGLGTAMALRSMARLAPLMAASTAGVIARRIDIDMRLSSAWEDGERIESDAADSHGAACVALYDALTDRLEELGDWEAEVLRRYDRA